MKGYSLIVMLLLCCSVAISQPNPKVFTTPEFVWCGLDYSKVRCIGPEGFNDPEAIKKKYFDGWNQLMLSESGKYDFKEAYQKEKQINDLSVVKWRNAIPEVNDLVITSPYTIPKADIEQIIATYDLETVKEGLGLVYIMESLDKTMEKATMHVVFFDIASKEIMWTSKYTSIATGFGFRNYWARPIYETIKDSKTDFKKTFKAYTKAQKKLK